MSDFDDDSGLLRQQRQFLQLVEFELRRVNRKVIHDTVPELNRESFIRLAHFVAEARSRYLAAALRLVGTPAGSEDADNLIATLKRERLGFEESRRAFAALERAIEQGYVDIKA